MLAGQPDDGVDHLVQFKPGGIYHDRVTGFLALRGLLHLLPENYLPVGSVSIDLRVLGFTEAASKDFLPPAAVCHSGVLED